MILPAFTKTYENREVLHFPGFTLEMGKIYAVIGANGSGKSTLVRILAGAVPSDQGRVTFRPAPMIGYMPQKSYAFQMSVKKNLLLNRPAGCTDAQANARAKRLLDELGLSRLSGQKASRLSGGETARMALARLMMKDYELLLLDEPTSAMDMQSTLQAEERICRYREETGAAVFLVTHSLAQARRIADEVLFFKDGCLIESGPASSVLSNPDTQKLREFLDFFSL